MKIDKNILEQAIQWRHDFHRAPEASGVEFKTAKKIREILKTLPNITVLEPFLETDVVAILHGNRAGKNVTLRADIDALKIVEETGVNYSSENVGLMHACGHDGHNATLLGAAKALSDLGNDFAGSIRFVWQPGEENIHLGEKLINADALENPKADIVSAIHGDPALDAGKIGCKVGAIMSGCAHFEIKVRGKGVHSSQPHNGIDPIVCSASLIVALQNIASRRVDPTKTAIVSICTVHGGEMSNVIPDEVVLSGTVRTSQSELETFLKNEFLTICNAVAMQHKCEIIVNYEDSYPVTENDSEATKFAKEVITKHLGAENYIDLDTPFLGAEDFAFYAKRYPAVYVKIGLGKDSAKLHNCKFNFNDDALENAINYFVNFALDYLKN